MLEVYILIPFSNHTTNTVSEALMQHVIPYFGTPRRLLSDRGREFIRAIWTKLLRLLGIQQVLTLPYHPEGNTINERSHRTLNNMLRARLLEGPSTEARVDKVLGIMLTLNAMPHEPHRFSASIIATGREPTLLPDLTSDASSSPAAEDHAKTLKFTAPDLPEPVPPVKEPRPPLGYLPAGFTHKPAKPRAPPVNRDVVARPPSAAPATPTVPAVPAAPANQNTEPAPPRRHSPRLNSKLGHVHAIKSQPLARQPHSAPTTRTANRPEMAYTYSFTINYNDFMGSKENPLTFANLRLVDLRNGLSQYLRTLKQLRDALPKMLDPASRFALRGHVARPGQLRLRHSMRAAL